MYINRQQEEYLRRTLDYSEDSTQPVSANSSVCEGPTSPVQIEHPMEVEATHSQEVESLKRLLQEVSTEFVYLSFITAECKLKLILKFFYIFKWHLISIVSISIKR